MARRSLEDIREEIKLEEQKANFRRKDGEINERYKERYNALVKEEKALVDAITKSRQAEVKVGQAQVKTANQLQKAEDDINKSLSSRITMLLKGNVLGAVGLGNSGEQAQATRDLAKEHNAVVEHIKSSNIGITKQAQLIDIAEKIQSGALTDEKNIQEQINAVGAEQSVNMSGILEKKSTETVLGAKNAKNLAMANKLLVGGGAIFAALLAIASKFADAVDAIGKQFGSLNVQSDEFKGNLMDSQLEVIGIGATMEDVVATTSALAGEFGISATEAADLSAQVIDTAKAVGLSNEEAAKLSGILQTTSGLSAQQAEQLTEGAFQLAVANNVAPDAVMKDLAGSAEEFASFSKDGGDNLVQAAIQARALGLSLQDTAKISEGLLNFQDSITKEVEASVLIGRQLNLQKARELALNNDIEGAMRAVVDQLGSEQEFNKLNAIQRKALADSIGVEVSQLAKLVSNSEKANVAAGETAKSFQDIIGKEAMSELTATMNELKVFGVAVAQTLGPPLMAIAKVVNFVLVPLGKMVAGISSGLRGIVGGASLDFTNAAGGSFGSNPRDSVMAANNTTSINNVTMNNGGNAGGGGTDVVISQRMVKLGGGDLGLMVDAHTYPKNAGSGRTTYDAVTGRV